MKPIILDNIVFKPDFDALALALRIRKDSKAEKHLSALLDQAVAVAKPKGAYSESFIDKIENDAVIIDGVRLNGKLLPVNLKSVTRVFPYLATCGTELETWAAGISGFSEKFWADTIMMFALGSALAEIDSHMEKLNPGARSSMNPGSLEEWPIQEQAGLFQILGDSNSIIGVKLTDSFMMSPLKSLSGINFPSEHSYENCKLCKREKCIGRRATYDPSLREGFFNVEH